MHLELNSFPSWRIVNLVAHFKAKSYVKELGCLPKSMGNGYTTTLLLKIFTQRNLIADYSAKKHKTTE